MVLMGISCSLYIPPLCGGNFNSAISLSVARRRSSVSSPHCPTSHVGLPGPPPSNIRTTANRTAPAVCAFCAFVAVQFQMNSRLALDPGMRCELRCQCVHSWPIHHVIRRMRPRYTASPASACVHHMPHRLSAQLLTTSISTFRHYNLSFHFQIINLLILFKLPKPALNHVSQIPSLQSAIRTSLL